MKTLLSSNYMRVFFLFFLTLSWGGLSAQSKIKGTAHQDYTGKPAYLYADADAISELKILIDSTHVSQDGKFEFDSPDQKIRKFTISIDRVNAPLFLAPGQQYELYFPQLPTNQARTFSNTNMVAVIFDKLPNNDINKLISDFNDDYDNFFDANVADFFDQDFQSKFNQFKLFCDTTYKPFKSTFLNDYINYAFASFQLSLGTSRKSISEGYLKDIKIDINNPEFAAFIGTFYGEYIDRFETFSKEKPLTMAIFKQNSTEFTEQLKKDDGLKYNNELREIVALVNLSQEYGKRYANTGNLLRMITEISKTAAGSQAKLLAQHLAMKLTQYSPGTAVYPFKLKRAEGTELSLDALKGKPAVLIFVAGWSKESLGQLKLIDPIYAKYAKDINFVLISLDDNEEEFQYLISASGTKIQKKASYLSDRYMIEAMNVIYVPQFMLIDRNGNYINNLAADPGRGLEAQIQGMLK